MPKYNWPDANSRSLIGKRINRLDGPAKASGAAKYSFDMNRPGMLFAKVVRSPYAHAKITKIDTSAAEKMPGVKAVRVIQNVGSEIQWHLDEIAVVAAVSEELAEDAARAIKIDYEVLPPVVDQEHPEKTVERKDPSVTQEGDADGALAAAEVKSEGFYGIAQISHCCLESHGQVCEWEGENLTAYCSTQAVSGLPGQFSTNLGIPASSVRIITQHMGGGFGSKFSADRWGIECAQLARQAKAPVKLMLERDAEMQVAGDRPSAYARITLGAKNDGTIVAWRADAWGSGGRALVNAPPIPYVFVIPNRKTTFTPVAIHDAGSRAWRAPNHPQACFLTMSALDDLAATLKMDPLEFFLKNITLTGERANVYAEELKKAAELMDWKKKWHPRGDSGTSAIKRGVGLSIHTWGGRAGNSNCEVVVHPDGGVEAKLGSQDLGVGTRTVIAIVLAETFGLPLEAVKVNIGDSRFPASAGSGGSTTVGGVSSSTRRAAQNALEMIFAKVAPGLEVPPEELEAVGGKIQVKGNPARSLPWKQAIERIGMNPIVATGAQPGEGALNSSGVGGAQMADVSVDTETGVVKINKMVAVQDCGLIIDMKTAESQVYGSLIMGVGYALMEEKILDPVTGRMLNPNMEFYKLAGIGDVGELVVHMMTGPGYDERGVVGLGEPPVISPGAAIANAVANAIGVRVPYMPLTPERVLAALKKGGAA